MDITRIIKNRLVLAPIPDHPLILGRNKKFAKRRHFVDGLDRSQLFLEVGPYFAPLITGPNVRYFDVFTTEELKVRASEDPNHLVNPKNIPDMHYTDPDGKMSGIKDKFDAAISSHCIEHQPDLVRHFNEIHDLLKPGGRYYLLVPDKRYCFDHYRPLSSLGSVLQAAREKRTRHSEQTILDHLSMTTHNAPRKHWRGRHVDNTQTRSLAQRAKHAIQLLDDSDGSYIDAHAWQFTPLSFARIIEAINENGLTGLKPVNVYDTPKFSVEFTAILERPE